MRHFLQASEVCNHRKFRTCMCNHNNITSTIITKKSHTQHHTHTHIHQYLAVQHVHFYVVVFLLWNVLHQQQILKVRLYTAMLIWQLHQESNLNKRNIDSKYYKPHENWKILFGVLHEITGLKDQNIGVFVNFHARSRDTSQFSCFVYFDIFSYFHDFSGFKILKSLGLLNFETRQNWRTL